MAMIQLLRTSSDNPDFIGLIKYLDATLAELDGDEHPFYAQFNKTNSIRHVMVAYDDGKAIGCGAIKEYAPGVMEVKRMYTLPEERGKGVATRILTELEKWAAELGCRRCILETGKKQTEAIDLYKRNGYLPIANYGQYAGVANSLCFEKEVGRI